MQTDSLATSPDPTGSPPALRRDWVASIVLRQSGSFAHRLALGVSRLGAMPRGLRRRLRRRAGLALGGAALLLALSSTPLLVPRAHAATIAVGGACSLVEAIVNANNDAATHADCAAGSGDDTITLSADVTLTAVYATNTGLPAIDSTITIDGNGYTISRDAGAPDFRLFLVDAYRSLTLQDVTISGGGNTGRGGAIFVGYAADLTIVDSVLTGNQATLGGAIYATDNSTLTITNSSLSGNTAGDAGGAIYGYDETTLNITNSTLSDNAANTRSGGAIRIDDYCTITIIDSTFSSNDAAANRGGAIYLEDDNTLSITGSTLSGNIASTGGGAIIGGDGNNLTIANSTLSGNSVSDGSGGAVSLNNSALTLLASTLTGNQASHEGGGLFSNGVQLTVAYSIVSGNTAGDSGDEIAMDSGAYDSAYNVLGHSGASYADAFDYFTPSGSDVIASSDSVLPTALADILDTTLANNGGPTETHALADGSPAIDLAPDAGCAAAPVSSVDQRGQARGVDVAGVGADGPGNLCDAGAYEVQVEAAAVFVSGQASGTTDDAVAFGSHDILMWENGNWSKWFDGAAAYLTPNGSKKHHVISFWIPDPAEPDVVLGFAHNARRVPGITPKVDGMDLVWWDGSAFSLWFDGQDVGLTNKTAEKIDAVHVLDGSLSPVGNSCLHYLLLSTQGAGQVPGAGGPIKFRGEDVLGFCMTNSGGSTTGFWHMLIDGSAEGMPANATTGLSFSDDGQIMYLTTRTTFNADAASGGHSMVYAYDFGTGEFSGPHFVAPAEGLPLRVSGLHVEGDLP